MTHRGHRDGIVATIALALSTLAMAAVVGTGAYARGAGMEAHGIQALSNTVACAVCPDYAANDAANAQLLAAAPEAE